MNNTIVPTEDGKDFVVLHDTPADVTNERRLRRDDSRKKGRNKDDSRK